MCWHCLHFDTVECILYHEFPVIPRPGKADPEYYESDNLPTILIRDIHMPVSRKFHDNPKHRLHRSGRRRVLVLVTALETRLSFLLSTVIPYFIYHGPI